VTQAMLTMAVPANTENPLEQRYLFEFFDRLYNSQANQDYAPNISTSAGLGNLFKGKLLGDTDAAIVIKDKRFKTVLKYSEIYKSRSAGNIGPVGTFTSGRGSATRDVVRYDSETQQNYTAKVPYKYHFYKKQVRPGLYEEVLIVGLEMLYYIEGSHKVTADENDDILLIPLDRSIVSKYSAADRELLYSRSLHYVFNSMQVIKIKWYQTGIFQVILTIVAIVMAVYDGGATLGYYLGLSGAAAIIATIVINLIIGEVLKVVFKLFAKIFGEDLAMLAAIVALVVSITMVIQTGSLKGAPWATDLLTAANGLSQAAFELGYDKLLDDSMDFAKKMEEDYKLLDTAKELLEQPVHLNPFVIFGESPTDYYNRTVHSGNIGVLGIDAVSKYTEIALTLPKFNDTIGKVL
jgi:hypothetical protein